MAVSIPNPQKFWSRHDWTLTIQREMADYRIDVGRRLRALRTNHNLSQEDAAHVVGVRQKTWGLWERGRSAPYESSWEKIKRGFELSDEQVAAIRGRPPGPLGLEGSDGHVDEMLSLLRRIDERLDRVEDLLTERELSELESEAEAQPPATGKPAGRRAAGGS